MKDINAIPIKAVIMNVIPTPLSGFGTLEYLIRSLIAAIATIAKKKARPIDNPIVGR